VFFIGIGLGVPLSRRLSPMQLAIGAPLIGALLAGVQYFDTHLWQAVVLSYIGAPFVGAYIIVLAPLLLQLLPRAGGLGERLGVLLAPFNLCSVILAYIAAVVIDATGNYRLIWLFPAVTGLAHAVVNCWLKYPARRATGPDMVGRLWEWSVVQAESMAETGIVTGLLAAPLLGVVTKEDADSAVVIDMARNILGNPYAESGTEGPPPADAAGGGTQTQSPADGGGVLRVTGVRQVGGGPDEGLAIGDQKSGWGPPTGVDAAEDSAVGAGDSAVGAGAGTGSAPGNGDTDRNGAAGGVPSGGVTSPPSAAGVPSAPAPASSAPRAPSTGSAGTDSDAQEGTAADPGDPDETGTTAGPGGSGP
jgi:hypothetical protein